MSQRVFVTGLLKTHDWLVKGLTAVAVGLLVPMMFLVSADVIGRSVFNSPIPAVVEINSNFLMVLVVFFPLAMVHRRRQHVFVSLFTDWLGARAKAGLVAASLLIGLAAYGLIGWYGLDQAVRATRVGEYISGIIDVPVWISRWIIPIGCLVFCIELVIDLVRQLKTAVGSSR
jgi:TRAP-type C4-dicarboxylate transport system permease small subunit